MSDRLADDICGTIFLIAFMVMYAYVEKLRCKK